MKDNLKNFWRFLNEDIWDIELTSLTRIKRIGIKSLRVLHLVFRGFRHDECPLHASALTFNTLMAVVPILALSLSLARVFGGDQMAERQVRKAVHEITSRLEVQAASNAVSNVSEGSVAVDGRIADGAWTPSEIADELNNAVDAGFRQVERINFAALGSLGLILLLWMVVAVLGKVEDSFNTVWGVTQGRPVFRKITDYLFMVIILPFLITMAASFSVAELVARFAHGALASGITHFVGTTIWKNLTTTSLTVFTFTLLIKFMPNTTVRWRPALSGGLVAALMFVLWLWICTTFQVTVAKYSKLYGSFAIVPIVLFWVYVSWEIVLFGAEVAFAVQNCSTYRMEYGSRQANVRSRLMLGLSVMLEAARAMLGKGGHLDVAEYAREHGIPVRFLNHVIEELENAGFLAAISGQEDSYVMLKLPSEVSARDVLDALMASGVRPEELGLAKVDSKVEQIVRAAAGGIGGSLSDKSIEELVSV